MDRKPFPTDFAPLRARLEALKPWYRERYLDPEERKTLSITEQDKLAETRMDIAHWLTDEERSRLSFDGQVRLSAQRDMESKKKMRDILAKIRSEASQHKRLQGRKALK